MTGDVSDKRNKLQITKYFNIFHYIVIVTRSNPFVFVEGGKVVRL